MSGEEAPAQSMREEAATSSPPCGRAQWATESTLGAGDSTPSAPTKDAALVTVALGMRGSVRIVARGSA